MHIPGTSPDEWSWMLSCLTIVLGKVDMDLYGALQLCSIGILTAPVTARLSKTYFNNPGRNTIFAWTVLVLAGKCACCLAVYYPRPN